MLPSPSHRNLVNPWYTLLSNVATRKSDFEEELPNQSIGPASSPKGIGRDSKIEEKVPNQSLSSSSIPFEATENPEIEEEPPNHSVNSVSAFQGVTEDSEVEDEPRSHWANSVSIPLGATRDAEIDDRPPNHSVNSDSTPVEVARDLGIDDELPNHSITSASISLVAAGQSDIDQGPQNHPISSLEGSANSQVDDHLPNHSVSSASVPLVAAGQSGIGEEPQNHSVNSISSSLEVSANSQIDGESPHHSRSSFSSPLRASRNSNIDQQLNHSLRPASASSNMVSLQTVDLRVVKLGQELLDKLALVESSVSEVHWERENFLKLGEFLRKLVPIVIEVKRAYDSTPNVLQIFEALNRDVENANQLIMIGTRKSRIYLLTHCRSVVKQLESVTHSIGRTVGLIPLLEIQSHETVKQLIDSLSRDMQKAQYPVQETDERICRTLELDQDSLRTDIAVQTGMVMDIARTLGVEDLPHNPTALKDQIELLRNDIQETRESYDLHMVDIIGDIFESWSQVHDHPSPPSETRQRLYTRVEPLYDAFICPLTKQVMTDPVTLENGQTYERSAIQRWFKQCIDNRRPVTCPMTGKELETTQLKPSIALRNTIEEWTARNEAARIDNARFLISSENCSEDDLLYALKDLQALVQRNRLNKYRIRNAGLIPTIVDLLKNLEKVRMRALVLLRYLAEDDDDNKEAMAEAGALRSALKCLSRAVSAERQEASALLYELSKSTNVCEQMGLTNGMILVLVGITSSKSDNVLAVEKAELTLENLERLDSNVRQMAENGRIHPLLRRLVEGAEEIRLEMANDLANIPLTTEGKILVAEKASQTLVSMLEDPVLVNRETALKAIRGLSTLDSNGMLLLDAGILPPLMRDLFALGASNVPMRMKELCATVLANLVSTTSAWQDVTIDDDGNTLISESIVHNLLYLLSNTGPIIEAKLLLVLVGLASSPYAVSSLISYIRSAGAIVTVIQFLEAPQDQLRVPAIRLLYLLSSYMAQELADGLRVTTRQLGTLVRLLGTDGIIEEQATAAALLANLPVEDFYLTRALLEENAFPILVKRIEEVQKRNVKIGEARYMATLQEGLVTILARFTYTLDDRDVVNLCREYDLAVFFTSLLKNTRSDEVQRQSAIALENLSTFTPQCRQEIPTPIKRGFFCSFIPCLSPPLPPTGICKVHSGRCTSVETFCLLEAKALDPLVACLDHHNFAVVEAALGALSTLLLDNVDSERGVQVLHSVNAIPPILYIMQEHRTQILRQKSVYMIERILRNGDLAQLISVDQNIHTGLVDALRYGNAATKPLAEKSLKHLNKIPNFSGVFTKIGPTKPGQRPPGY